MSRSEILANEVIDIEGPEGVVASGEVRPGQGDRRICSDAHDREWKVGDRADADRYGQVDIDQIGLRAEQPADVHRVAGLRLLKPYIRDLLADRWAVGG